MLTFSIPLDPDQDFSRVIHVVDKKAAKWMVPGELSDNLKELRLRHLEPKRDLIPSLLARRSKRSITQPLVKMTKNYNYPRYQPSVGFASRGSLLPGKVVEGLPVMALNVNNVDVNFFRVETRICYPLSLASGNTAIRWRTGGQINCCRWRIWSTGRFDLNPARNTREKLLLPLGDIKPLQQAGVYLAVMNQAGRYDYSNPATLFTLSDIGVSAHRYHNRLDIFTQSLENGAALQGN